MSRHDLVCAIALRKGMKAEAHRLGHEMSKDALSWNDSRVWRWPVSCATQFLTGRVALRTFTLGALYR
jgi:hypothetical protein